jgi:hypothetical protein
MVRLLGQGDASPANAAPCVEGHVEPVLGMFGQSLVEEPGVPAERERAADEEPCRQATKRTRQDSPHPSSTRRRCSDYHIDEAPTAASELVPFRRRRRHRALICGRR